MISSWNISFLRNDRHLFRAPDGFFLGQVKTVRAHPRAGDKPRPARKIPPRPVGTMPEKMPELEVPNVLTKFLVHEKLLSLALHFHDRSCGSVSYNVI